MSQKEKDNISSFVMELVKIQNKFNIELDTDSLPLYDKSGIQIGRLEENYDTYDVVFEDDIIVSLRKDEI